MGREPWAVAFAVLLLAAWAGIVRAQEPPAPGKQEVTVGIFSQDAAGAPDGPIQALLTAVLSPSRNLRLVERTEIDKVLEEQKLAGLTAPANAVKIGRLVGANMLLLSEMLRGTEKPAVRVRAVDTIGGVVVMDEIVELSWLTQNADLMRGKVEAASRKACLPVAQRDLIGVIGVSSGEINTSLDALAAALGVFLRVDLAKSSRVVVLEREQLEHLAAEPALSGMEVKLRASTRLVDVRIAKHEITKTGGVLLAKVRIRQMGTNEAKTLDVTLPDNDIQAARKALGEAVLKALLAPLPPAVSAGDIHAEAKVFAGQARLLALHGYVRESIPLAEAAWALDPSPETYLMADQCYRRVIHDANLPDIERLKANRRQAEMHVECVRQLLAQQNWRVLYDAPLGLLAPKEVALEFLRLCPPPDPPVTPEDRVVQQIIDLMNEEYRIRTAAYHQSGMWLGPSCDYGSCFYSNGPEYCKVLQEVMREFDSQEAKAARERTARWYHGSRPSIYPDISWIMAVLNSNGRYNTITMPDVRPVLVWLTQQTNPVFRAEGWNALAYFPGDEGDRAAAKALDILFREKADGALTKIDVKYDDFPAIIDQAYRRMVIKNLLPTYTAALLDELKKNGDAAALVRWPKETMHLLSGLEPDMSVDSFVGVDRSYLTLEDCSTAPPWTSRAVDIEYFFAGLPGARPKNRRTQLGFLEQVKDFIRATPTPGQYATNRSELLRRLDEDIFAARKSLGLLPPDKPWAELHAREIPLGDPPVGTDRLIWADVDRTHTPADWVLVWQGLQPEPGDKPPRFQLVVRRMALHGGHSADVAREMFDAPAGYNTPGHDNPRALTSGRLPAFQVTGMAVGPEGIFLADYNRGILVARAGRIAVWTGAQGLPTRRITSLAYCAGSLYAGMQDGLVKIDPTNGRCTTVASGKALMSSNPFNGGQPYRISQMLAQPDGDSLWLSVDGDQTRRGIWRYRPRDNVFKRVAGPFGDFVDPDSSIFPGPRLSWHDGKILVMGLKLELYDPRTEKFVALAGYREDFYWRSPSYVVVDTAPDGVNTSFDNSRAAALLGASLISSVAEMYLPDGTCHELDKAAFYPRRQHTWDAVIEADSGCVTVDYGSRKSGPPCFWYLTPPGRGSVDNSP